MALNTRPGSPPILSPAPLQQKRASRCIPRTPRIARQSPGHVRLAQPHGGRHLHPVDVESHDAGANDLQGVVVETARHGPGGRGDGSCHHHLTFRRKRGGRLPVCGSAAEAIVSTSWGVHCTGRVRGRAQCGRLTSVWIPGTRSDAPHQSSTRCDLGPASADTTLVKTPDATTTRAPPWPEAARIRDVSCRRSGRDADHECWERTNGSGESARLGPTAPQAMGIDPAEITRATAGHDRG